MLNIFVVMKKTFDTEEKIVLQAGKIEDADAKFIINPYDEYAIEEALLVREQHGGEVTVISVGDKETEATLRTALAMGCDQAVLINYDLNSADECTVANILAKYLENRNADLIFGGNYTIDGGSGQIGSRLAELLGITHISTIVKFELEGDTATIHRDVEGDLEIIEATLPLLVTAQQGLNEPRYPSLPGIMKAKKKPLTLIEISEIGLEETKLQAPTKQLEVLLPPTRGEGRILQGDPSTQIRELISLLQKEEKVI